MSSKQMLNTEHLHSGHQANAGQMDGTRVVREAMSGVGSPNGKEEWDTQRHGTEQTCQDR